MFCHADENGEISFFVWIAISLSITVLVVGGFLLYANFFSPNARKLRIENQRKKAQALLQKDKRQEMQKVQHSVQDTTPEDSSHDLVSRSNVTVRIQADGDQGRSMAGSGVGDEMLNDYVGEM